MTLLAEPAEHFLFLLCIFFEWSVHFLEPWWRIRDASLVLHFPLATASSSNCYFNVRKIRSKTVGTMIVSHVMMTTPVRIIFAYHLRLCILRVKKEARVWVTAGAKRLSEIMPGE